MNFYTNLCTDYFYLHGAIEDIIGYDIVGSNTKPKIGIYPCTVNGKYKCICYSWYRRLGQCGLICLENDVEANRWCKNKYDTKSNHI